MGTLAHQFDAAPLDRPARSVSKLRRDTRTMVALTCQLRIGGGAWRPGSLVDLSCSGFRIAWLPSCGPGKPIWVKIPGLEAMPAKVRWQDLGGVGCQFDRPLNPVIVEHLLRKGGRG